MIGMTALFAMIGCALAFAALDVVRKLLGPRLSSAVLVSHLLCWQVVLVAIWMIARGEPIAVGPGYWRPALVTVTIALMANVLFFRAVTLSPLSRTIPLLAITPAATALLSAVLLGEWLSSEQWGGIILIGIGIAYLYADDISPRALLGVVAGFRREPGALPMLGTALLWSASGPFDKMALGHASISTHAILQLGAAGIALTIWAMSRKQPFLPQTKRRETFALILLAAFLATLALFLQFEAYQLTFVSIVEAVKRVLGQISAVIVGALFFAEGWHRSVLLGIALMSIGVPLVLLG